MLSSTRDILLSSAVFLFACLAVSQATCPSGWKQGGTRCYKFSTIQKSWTDSRLSCRAESGELAIFEDQAEHAIVAGLRNCNSLYQQYYWVGGKQIATGSSTFKWTDGSDVSTPDLWWPGEPNNIFQGPRQCLDMGTVYQIDSGIAYRLNDWLCSNPLEYICERPLNLPTPCPGDWKRDGILDNTCYQFFTTKEKWNKAKNECAALSGTTQLVVVKNAQQAETLGLVRQENGIANDYYWVSGQQDNPGSQNFLNLDNTAFNGDLWGPDEPSNTCSSRRQCVDMGVAPQYHYSDWTCSRRLAYACERTI